MGYSKKSLDDYLLQIRFGSRFGFDFEAHRHDKVGFLRRFVANHKKLYKQKMNVKRIKVNSLPMNIIGLSDEFVMMLTDLRTQKGKSIKSKSYKH